MPKFKDLTGMKFGRLTAIRVDEEKSKKSGRTCWLCKCDCGNVVSVYRNSLLNGNTKSCGCYNSELTVKRNTKHNMYHTRIYKIYRGMLNRCNNTNLPRYNDYGGRGIKVCEEWSNDFISFYDWAISNGYQDDLTIDRIDNNGDYCPENCRWVDDNTQANNTRKTIYINIGDTKMSLRTATEKYAPTVKYITIKARYYREGFQSVEQLFRDKAS